jgi:hypothetical protein
VWQEVTEEGNDAFLKCTNKPIPHKKLKNKINGVRLIHKKVRELCFVDYNLRKI